MTDLVERLRKLAKANEWRTPAERELWNGLDEAADEIERLRTALQAAETWLDAAYDDGPGRDAYDVVCRALENKP